MSKSWWKAIAALLLILLAVREAPRWWDGAPAVTVDNGLEAGAGALEALSARLLATSRWLRNVGNESGPDQSIQRAEPCEIAPSLNADNVFAIPPSVPEDQAKILALHGPPDAFTFLVEAADGSIFEAWVYRDLGRQLHFLNGAYTGGLQTEPSEAGPGQILPVYPWQLRRQPTPACVVPLAGPAVFLTSALVLPGWNDDRQVARSWRLAGGGTMITVDGRLAAVQLDPLDSFDDSEMVVPDLFVGTVVGSERLGAILSAREDGVTYRLSLSVRGQGTTEDGTEVVLDYASDGVAGTFDLSNAVQASHVTYDGEERHVTSAGELSVIREGNAVMLEINGIVNGEALTVAGWLQNGVWR